MYRQNLKCDVMILLWSHIWIWKENIWMYTFTLQVIFAKCDTELCTKHTLIHNRPRSPAWQERYLCLEYHIQSWNIPAYSFTSSFYMHPFLSVIKVIYESALSSIIDLSCILIWCNMMQDVSRARQKNQKRLDKYLALTYRQWTIDFSIFRTWNFWFESLSLGKWPWGGNTPYNEMPLHHKHVLACFWKVQWTLKNPEKLKKNIQNSTQVQVTLIF